VAKHVNANVGKVVNKI